MAIAGGSPVEFLGGSLAVILGIRPTLWANVAMLGFQKKHLDKVTLKKLVLKGIMFMSGPTNHGY